MPKKLKKLAIALTWVVLTVSCTTNTPQSLSKETKLLNEAVKAETLNIDSYYLTPCAPLPFIESEEAELNEVALIQPFILSNYVECYLKHLDLSKQIQEKAAKP